MTTKDTFHCHVCGAERPDDKIGVISRVFHITDDDAGAATASENMRYCIDRDECVEGVVGVSLLDKSPGMRPPAHPHLRAIDGGKRPRKRLGIFRR